MEHHFDIEIASKYGVNVAILLNNLVFWIKSNEANSRNFFDGNYWTYNSKKAYATLFPYMSQRQIETAFQKMKDEGLIVTGNYNENKYDRTLWYALTDLGKCITQYGEMHITNFEESILQNDEMDFTNEENPLPQNVKCIDSTYTESIHTDSKPNNKHTDNKQDNNSIPPSISPPTVTSLVDSYAFADELRDTVLNWLRYKREKREGYKETGLKALLSRIQNAASKYGDTAVIAVINDSMSSNYTGIVFDRLEKAKPTAKPPDRLAWMWEVNLDDE